MHFAQKSKKTQVQVMHTDMEDLGRSQAKMIKDLNVKLAAQEEKGTLKTATKEKVVLGGQSAKTQEQTHDPVSLSTNPLLVRTRRRRS